MWFSPDSLDGAAALLAEHGAGLRIIAGGTDLMVERKLGAADPATGWLDLSRVQVLNGITTEGGALRIGAATPLRSIGQDPDVRACFPMLAQSAAVTGATPIQNRATLGGNIANASPAADNPPVMLAYRASV
ncbi:MAG: FAD binding domain-containing protein, partial [Gammaproteobacteria bacterium]